MVRARASETQFSGIGCSSTFAAWNLAPAIPLVLAYRPVKHRHRIQIQVLPDGEGVERTLQARAAGNELLHAGGLAALVIDDDAIVAEPVDSIDAAPDGDRAGKFKLQRDLGGRGIGRPQIVGAHTLRDFAELHSLDFEPVSGGQMLCAACFVEGFFEEFDEIAALVREPALERDVQNGTRDARLQTIVRTIGRTLQRKRSAAEEFEAALGEIFEGRQADRLMQTRHFGMQEGRPDTAGDARVRRGDLWDGHRNQRRFGLPVKAEVSGTLHGSSGRVMVRIAEKERSGRARRQGIEKPALLAFVIVGFPQVYAGRAQTIDIVIREQQILGLLPGEIAIRHAADEERSNVPLTRLVYVHHMDDIGAVVGGMENGGIDGDRSHAPEVVERYRLVGIGPEPGD